MYAYTRVFVRLGSTNPKSARAKIGVVGMPNTVSRGGRWRMDDDADRSRSFEDTIDYREIVESSIRPDVSKIVFDRFLEKKRSS